MRARVEAGGFEVFPSVFQKGGRPCGGRRISAKQPIDVVDAEADALHVERRDGPGQRFALGDDRASTQVTARLQHGTQLVDARLRLLTMINSHDRGAYQTHVGLRPTPRRALRAQARNLTLVGMAKDKEA